MNGGRVQLEVSQGLDEVLTHTWIRQNGAYLRSPVGTPVVGPTRFPTVQRPH